MVETQTLLIGVGGLVAAEATGTTDFTSIGGSSEEEGDGSSGSGLGGLASGFEGLAETLTNQQEQQEQVFEELSNVQEQTSLGLERLTSGLFSSQGNRGTPIAALRRTIQNQSDMAEKTAQEQTSEIRKQVQSQLSGIKKQFGEAGQIGEKLAQNVKDLQEFNKRQNQSQKEQGSGSGDSAIDAIEAKTDLIEEKNEGKKIERKAAFEQTTVGQAVRAGQGIMSGADEVGEGVINTGGLVKDFVGKTGNTIGEAGKLVTTGEANVSGTFAEGDDFVGGSEGKVEAPEFGGDGGVDIPELPEPAEEGALDVPDVSIPDFDIGI